MTTPTATAIVTEDFLGSKYCAKYFPVSHFMELSQNPKWWVLTLIPDNKGENRFRKIEHLTQVKWLISDPAGIWSQACVTPSPRLYPPSITVSPLGRWLASPRWAFQWLWYLGLGIESSEGWGSETGTPEPQGGRALWDSISAICVLAWLWGPSQSRWQLSGS